MYNSTPMYSSAPVMTSALERTLYSSAPQMMYNAQAVNRDKEWVPRDVFAAHVTKAVYEVEENDSSYTVKENSFYELFTPKIEYDFQPEAFLRPGFEGEFVGGAEEMREHIEEAFEELMGESFPSSIRLSVLKDQEFSKMTPSPGVLGLSINRGEQGLISEVFVRAGPLGRVMLTIGHEIGHVLSKPLATAQLEEAKAYAFSFAWMKAIKDKDIAGLASALVIENPAKNGVHDKGLEIVAKGMEEKEAFEVWQELVLGKKSLIECCS